MKFLYTALLFVLFSASCLQNKTDRGTYDISQKWELIKKEYNGNNVTDMFKAAYKDYTLQFSETGTFSETYTDGLGVSQTITGTWIFQNHVRELKMEDDMQTRFFDIVELNGARLTLQTLSSANEEIFYFEPL